MKKHLVRSPGRPSQGPLHKAWRRTSNTCLLVPGHRQHWRLVVVSVTSEATLATSFGESNSEITFLELDVESGEIVSLPTWVEDKELDKVQQSES